MSKKFFRENRYIVLKLSDIREYLNPFQKEVLLEIRDFIDVGREQDGKEPLEAIVIEHDWPEYDPVWDMLEKRVMNEEE